MKYTFTFLILVFFLSSCSKSMVHTWNIDKLEIKRENGKNSTYDNIGTITFNKNGTGNNNFNIIESEEIDTASFKWEESDGNILLKPLKKEDSSRLFKAWIITEREAKKQVWKSTNGKNDIEILVISRN
ncbi:MAG TPA: hypothetical protein VK021_06620 [Flavobacteriaceae bacterium]|nr:hypothetical protein [Flavobacteriaceae bacterium]